MWGVRAAGRVALWGTFTPRTLGGTELSCTHVDLCQGVLSGPEVGFCIIRSRCDFSQWYHIWDEIGQFTCWCFWQGWGPWRGFKALQNPSVRNFMAAYGKAREGGSGKVADRLNVIITGVWIWVGWSASSVFRVAGQVFHCFLMGFTYGWERFCNTEPYPGCHGCKEQMRHDQHGTPSCSKEIPGLFLWNLCYWIHPIFSSGQEWCLQTLHSKNLVAGFLYLWLSGELKYTKEAKWLSDKRFIKEAHGGQ